MFRFALLLSVFVMASISVARPVNAGLFLCNDSGEKISLAIGYPVGNQWWSKGWFNIEPRECTLPIEGVLNNQYYYYYAWSESLEWEGTGNNSRWFCADKTARFSSLRDGPCTSYQFRQIDTKGRDTFTLRLNENRTDPLKAARNCRSQINEGRDAFVNCWIRQVSTARQKQILSCMRSTKTDASLFACAVRGDLPAGAKRLADCSDKYRKDKKLATFVNCATGSGLDRQDVELINCTIKHKGQLNQVLGCAAEGRLGSRERRIFNCVSRNLNDYRSAGLCLVGSHLSNDQKKVASCVLRNRGSYMQMGICIAGEQRLTPEQQAFVQCASTSGGQPWAFAGCVGTQLTVNELEKCFTVGIGGRGCFGDNNTLVKFVNNAWKDVTQGPGPNNDLVGMDGFVMRNMRNIRRDVTRGPGPNNDLVGRDGFVGRTLRNAERDLREGPGPNNEICKLTPFC